LYWRRINVTLTSEVSAVTDVAVVTKLAAVDSELMNNCPWSGQSLSENYSK